MNITVSLLLWLGVQLGVAPQACEVLDADHHHQVCASTQVHEPDEADDQDSDGGLDRTVASSVFISNGF